MLHLPSDLIRWAVNLWDTSCFPAQRGQWPAAQGHKVRVKVNDPIWWTLEIRRVMQIMVLTQVYKSVEQYCLTAKVADKLNGQSTCCQIQTIGHPPQCTARPVYRGSKDDNDRSTAWGNRVVSGMKFGALDNAEAIRWTSVKAGWWRHRAVYVSPKDTCTGMRMTLAPRESRRDILIDASAVMLLLLCPSVSDKKRICH